MKNTIRLLSSILLFFVLACNPKQDASNYDYAIVIHGGAGWMVPENFSEEAKNEYTRALESALDLGMKILNEGGAAVDAVESVIVELEDSPLFNAGKGAVFTHEGINELDASIMTGEDLNAGAVTGIRTVKNPIRAARKVMTDSKHVMLSGRGAEKFAELQGLERVDPVYFYTPDSYNSLLQQLEKEGDNTDTLPYSKLGTVGCVALDKSGNICAGTSTGGMTNKKHGRIGDSPVIGAGTYANNATCGVSATGHGEFFIRYAASHEISALMMYNNMSVAEAAEEVVMNQLKNAGAYGGVVCLDSRGNSAMVFNTPGMFRACGNSDGQRTIGLFSDKE